ncbi:MAG: SUMF1/EgtB/PvdO family nonheme iron enzyme [Planctomycetota bacterium]|nr:SUMF1/EgtB/PvdO family nonheme iron enzyme [Planctomycetota bacterium]
MSDQPNKRPWFQFRLLALVWCATGSLSGSGTAGLLLAVRAAEQANTQPAFPLWDGHESIEQYARRANLPPTKTLDLGNGVNLEFVLIPAGKFIMGTPKPKPVDEDGFRKKIIAGRAIFALGVGVLLVFIATVIIRAIRQRHRPQYSLARFLAMIVAAGLAVLGGMHWWYSMRALAQAQAEYQAAVARYRVSDADEKPAHEVTLTTPFYLGKWEVTQEQYAQVMGTNPSYFKGATLPVEQVSWDDAQEFCKKLSEKPAAVAHFAKLRGNEFGQQQSGKMLYSLPTEAQWEFACRAGSATKYCFGDSDASLGDYAWYSANSASKTHPVGQKKPNAWGLYDMHGNVWEWVQDRYSDKYYQESPPIDPKGPETGTGRVLRGGCWVNDPDFCRAAHRGRYAPGYRYAYFGFRAALDF